MSGLWGGTFHHMANRMLRRHASLLGYTQDFSIMDQDDSRALTRACVEDLGLKTKEFPKPDVLLGLFGLSVGRSTPLEIVVLSSILFFFTGRTWRSSNAEKRWIHTPKGGARPGRM